MRKRVKGVILSRKKEAKIALSKSLARGLILSGKIKTTKARAKFTQMYIEKLVTLAKKNSLYTKRKIFSKLSNKVVAKKLITEIGPRFANQASGFTRIVNLGGRRGDAAPMALLEFAYPAKEATEETPLRSAKQSSVGQAKETKSKREGAKNATK